MYMFIYLFAEICVNVTLKIPFCKKWMCKSACWLQKNLRPETVKEHKCVKGGIKGRCHCIICKNIPQVSLQKGGKGIIIKEESISSFSCLFLCLRYLRKL